MNRRVEWLLPATIVAAVFGGVLGVRLWDVEFGPMLAVLVVTTALGTVASLGWVRAEPEPGQSIAQPTPPPDALPRPSPAPTPPAPRQQLYQPPQRPADQAPQTVPSEAAAWWNKSPQSPPKPADTALVAQAPPLSSYQAHRARHVQCPGCGGFEIDLNSDGESYTFRCRNEHCGQIWQWAPGTAWPPTVVRRNLTGHEPDQAEHIQG
ncbi:hypothetical protein [Alloactinosynnema sp. L-07]|uniref:hypothetical protein n=1 Tax=Alloactinosynnema sp. L-07 TaxID=1653480 RepID=UPI00065EF631|nr:hypothetical protein [Alloactinosynnema sp. L-07]CRK59109.1 hypothetical protein [Alloactinosynnema sp. L-07]